MRVVLQPAGAGAASIHYVDTIENPVPISTVTKHLSKQDAAFVRELYPSGMVPVWGVTPGKNNVNIGKWQNMSPGDVALFSRRGRIFSAGEVTFKVHTRGLALELWKTNEDGETWEYVYLLDHMRELDIPYEPFNAAAGYAANNIIQGFTVISEAKSARVLDALQIALSPTTANYEHAIKELDGLKALDAKREALVRMEQGYIRAQLFGGKQFDNCCICGKSFPVAFLVAAHIKRRALCSADEKKAISANVVPMCSFGCDDLFERGYIFVKAGKVTVRKDKPLTSGVSAYLASIKGKACGKWSAQTRPSFEWHENFHTAGDDAAIAIAASAGH